MAALTSTTSIYIRLFLFFGCVVLLLSSCSSYRSTTRYLQRQIDAPEFQRQFTGLLMVDADSGDTLIAENTRKAFTPASNMKLFTLYAAMKMLPERIPALKYRHQGDTLWVLGTGDPAALHPDLADSTAWNFLQKASVVAMANENLSSRPYGSGWAWDDFDQYYQPRRSSLPIHGNIVRWIGAGDSLRVEPGLFRDSLKPSISGFQRKWQVNEFYAQIEPGDTLDIPIYTHPEMERALWSYALGRPVIRAQMPMGALQSLPGIAADSLYARMMQLSDNFIAEQLMLLVSSTLSDSLSFERARDTVLDSFLSDLPQRPRWVDGSGLSRYNLVTPQTLVDLLGRLYREFPRERLFRILAHGGGRGTLEHIYADRPQPYLYGKTGSLSNNHNLSGFLRTDTGKMVLFSFMNNHYQEPTRQVQERMQRLLKWVRDHY